MAAARPERVQVLLRTRPAEQPTKDIVTKGDKTVHVHLPPSGRGVGVAGGVNNQPTDWAFQFDDLLTDDASQARVYDIAAKDIVENVMQGFNGTIMAYGQTGAGKTYTIVGDKLNYENRGIIPRAIGHIFRAINDRPDLAFTVHVSYIENYGEHLFDLLASRPSGAFRNPSMAQAIDLAIQEDPHSGAVSVKGLERRPVFNEQECLDALFQGEAQRAVGEHALNEQSTRSHCIYTIHLEIRSRVESSEKVIVSKLNLVDLAGSERLGKTQSSGVVASEAKSINRSLSFLEQVVVALSSKSRDHIPFRSCKLTTLLKDSLAGNTRTRLICNVHSDRANLEETLSTLKFGARMRKLHTRVEPNIALDPMLHVAKLQRQVRELKQELAMHDTIANRVGVTYEPYTPEESDSLRKQIEEYVQGGPAAEELEIVNLRQVRECFRLFKAMVLDAQRGQPNPLPSRSPTRLSSHAADAAEEEDALDDGVAVVGDVDEQASGGFGVGQVAADRKPAPRPDSRDEPLKPRNIMRARARTAGQNVASPIAESNRPHTQAGHTRSGSASRRAGAGSLLPPVNVGSGSKSRSTQGLPTSEEKTNHGITSPHSRHASGTQANGAGRTPSLAPPPAESSAFEDFKSGPGFDQHSLLSQAKSQLSSQKRAFREASLAVNEVKARLDALREELAAARAERLHSAPETADPALDGEVEVLSEAEYEALQASAAAKAEYKQLYAARSDLERELHSTEEEVHHARAALFSSFRAWFVSQFGSEPSLATASGAAETERRAEEQRAHAQRNEARKQQAAQQQRLMSHEAADLDTEARSFLQATRNLQQHAKQRPMLNGGRRPYVGAPFR